MHINDYSLAILMTLARGDREGGIYRLLVVLVALVHSSEWINECSISRRIESM